MTGSNASSDQESHSSAPFVWPPEAAPTAQPERLGRPSISIRRPNRLIESIETHLLGRTALAFDQWALHTGWARDHQNDYCWRCGSSIGAHEADGDGCASCREKPLPWDRAIRLGKYEKDLRREVLALKFAGWRPTGTGLGVHLGLAIREQLDLAQIAPANATLIPIPMHRFRRLARGVDHTLVIARGASDSSGCKVGRVLKARYRPEQVGLSKTARAQNIKGAFFSTNRTLRTLNFTSSQDRHALILIDDVRTTGATFVAGAKSLKQALKDDNAGIKGQISVFAETTEIWIASIGVAGESRRGIVEAHD